MDAGKEIIHEQARQERAKDVMIQFVDDKFQHFNVISDKDETDKKTGLIKVKQGDIKHIGAVWGKEPSTKDFCTCESFWYSNSDDYKKTHATSFNCKHILSAREIRFEGHPIEQTGVTSQ